MAHAGTSYPPAPALYKMLTYRRPHNSEGEKDFIKDFIMPLRPYIVADGTVPMAFIVDIGDACQSNIMFTSHVDTVHGPGKTRQQVILKDGLYQKNDNQPLGADDAAGVWLMLNMIHKNIPGVYAFFRGEERGGIGSSWCAKNRPDLFNFIKYAIAFDRRGTQSIITFQGGSRGCSDEFARSLSRILGMGHTCDKGGIYTDTAEFFDLVDNCTNVSVGYQNEHSKNETLDKAYIEQLRDKLIVADWSKLDSTPPNKLDSAWDGFGYPDVDDKAPTIGMRAAGSQKLFRDNPYKANDPGAIDPKDIADFVFDNVEVLPKPLQEEALALCQKIYKRFE